MISSSGGSPERSRTARAARKIARDLHLVDLRVEDRRAGTPRVPSIGFVSCSECTRSSVLLELLEVVASARCARARPRCATSSTPGRNSCSGGSSRRIVTGRPAISSKRPSKSCCWSGSSSSSAARRSSSVSAMIIARIFGWRSAAMNMCSVRQRPMPSAPNSRALRGVLGRVGVGAHAERAQLVGPAEHRLEVRRSTSGSTSGTSSAVTMPRACRRSRSGRPRCSTRAVHAHRLRPSGRSRAPTAPDTHGLPIPRATSAAWLALPPSRGEDALARRGSRPRRRPR